MTTRRTFVQSAGALAAAGLVPGLLGTRLAHGQAIPAGYPGDYAGLVAAARKEGKLLVYSNMSNPNWAPITRAFNQRYPDIKIDMLDLGGESVPRYLAEKSTGVTTADFIVTAHQVSWMDMAKRGEIADYVSPEAAAWPEWSKPLVKGLYTLSADPLFFAWNNTKLPEARRPKTFAEFAAMAEGNKDWARKLTSYNPMESLFGFAANWYFVKHHGEEKGWKMLEQLGRSQPRFESGGGPQIEKVTTGEYVGAYFLSAIQTWPRVKDPTVARFLGWNFIGDGQPMMMRGAAVTKAGKNPNAARLFADYCLSLEGQAGFGMGGLTPARPDLKPTAAVPHTFSSVSQAVGEKNIILVGYDERLVTEQESFRARFKKAFPA
jgi:iron(III) transport system substrate-binding protein